MIEYKLIKILTSQANKDAPKQLTFFPEINSINYILALFANSECFSNTSIDNFIKLYKTENKLTNQIIKGLIDYENAVNKITGDILFSTDGEYHLAYLSKDKKKLFTLTMIVILVIKLHLMQKTIIN
jgi:hypothetical protein